MPVPRGVKSSGATPHKLNRSAPTLPPPPAAAHHSRKRFYLLIGAATGALLLLGVLILLLVKFQYRSSLDWYNLGLYGPAPSRRYVTFPGSSPELHFAARDDRCNRGLAFLAPMHYYNYDNSTKYFR
ncbi:hypothetical protein BP00DRAFT_445510 [Aspergillus indologenus CBS 114.80]|uniref:Uncharacterized protein n=1 Tax=Aspergillus indologenus CBS 114.80 TaxID=1450541 RepID=A0A2V5I8U2_9EURO|nr:hypothetical protein BP00DRAFT_445510 [Aspergillus indologenus CBS 114.80]